MLQYLFENLKKMIFEQTFCLPHEQYAIFLLVYMKLFCKHKVLLCNIEQEYTVVAELFIIC